MLGGTAADTGTGIYGAQTLRVTLAANDPLTYAMAIDLDVIAGDTTEIAANWTAHDDSVPSKGVMQMGEAKSIDGSVFSSVGHEGDSVRLASSLYGVQYVTLMSHGGNQPLCISDNIDILGTAALVPVGGMYNSSPVSYTDGYGSILQTNVNGYLKVISQANSGVDIGDVDITSIAAGDNNIGNVDIVTLPASTNTIEVVGDAAEDAAVAGNPVLVGGRYDSSDRSLDDGDAGAIALTAAGRVQIDWEGDGLLAKSVISVVTSPYGVADRNFQVAPSVRSDTLAALGNSADGDWSPMQVDALGALYTTHGITGGADGVTVVSTAGTDVVLGGNVACKKIDIQAQTDNTGVIAVGFTGVDAAEAAGTGVILYPGDTYSLEINNLNLIYIDSAEDGEGVRYTYFT